MPEARDVCIEAVKICAERNTYCKSLLEEAKAMETVYRRGACYIIALKKDGTLSLTKVMVNGFMRKAMEIPEDILNDWLDALLKVLKAGEGGAGEAQS